MHGLDIRYKALTHYQHFNGSLRRVARLYGVSKSSLQRWATVGALGHRYTMRCGKGAPRREASKPQLVGIVRESIDRLVSSNPYVTAADVAHVLKADCGCVKSRRSVSRYLRAMSLTRKKAYRTFAYSHSPTDVQRFCQQYQAADSGGNLVCIDEVGFYVGDCGRYGYAPKGRRLNVRAASSLRCSKYTVVMAINAQKVVHYEVLSHNCKKADFVGFVSRLPVAPGSILLMDNVAFHHSRETVEAVRSIGCQQLFSPPYSPRFNPIELFFGVVKASYRRSCPSFTTTRPVTPAIYVDVFREAVTRASPAGLAAYFRHVSAVVKRTEAQCIDGTLDGFCGYDSS